MNGESLEDQASLYVLGLMAPDEAREFEAAMAANPELAELARRAEQGAAALAWTVPPRDPPPHVRERIAQAIRQEASAAPGRVVAPFPRRAAWLPWGIAAGLALMVCALGYKRYQYRIMIADFVIRDHNLQAEADRAQRHELALAGQLRGAGTENAALLAQLAAARSDLAQLQNRNALADVKIAMLASMAKDAPEARAVVAWDGDTQRGIVKTLGLPAATSDQDYQLWVIDPAYQSPVSAGVFNPATGGSFVPVHRIMKADKFAVSLEKKGGSDVAHGPIVLVSE